MKTQFTRLGAFALLLMAGAAAPAYAQDAKAADVLAKTRKALGDKKLQELKTLSLQATLDRNVGNMQTSGEVELFVEMPDKFVRTEAMGRSGMTMSTGFNGEKAILPGGANMSIGAGGAMVFRMGPGGAMQGEGATKPTPEQLAQLNTVSLKNSRTEVSRMMLGWFGAAHPSLQAKYTYAGEAESPDGKAHVIDVKDSDGFEARLFIDQNNFLPLMVTYKGRQARTMVTGGGPAVRTTGSAPAGAQTRELTEEERKKAGADAERMVSQQMAEQPLVDFSLFFDGWQQVDGLTFPHKMRRAVAGETNEEWTFTKVKVNPKIDAAKFAVESK